VRTPLNRRKRVADMLRFALSTIAAIAVALAIVMTGQSAIAQQDPPDTLQQPTEGTPGTEVKVTTADRDRVTVEVTPTCPGCSHQVTALNLDQPPQEIFEALPRFGASVFGSACPICQLPVQLPSEAADRPLPGAVAKMPVPPNYVLGAGDQLSLLVTVRGWEQVDETLAIAPDGFVFALELGRISAAGQTLEQLRQKLADAYGRLYVNPTISLTVSAQRTVEIYVTGDATVPGKYLLTGAPTVFTALHAAGGPSEIGSLRSLQLHRMGQPSMEIDLYDYLMTGNRNADVLLQPGDTLFIPPVGAEVALAGQARRPGRYELKSEATLADALQMAGGLKPAAYGPMAHLWHTTERAEWQLAVVNCGDPTSADLQLPMQDGNLLIVHAVRPSGANTVHLIGAVKRPGYYPVGAATTVREVLEAAEGPAWNAHMSLAVVRRQDAARHFEIIEFDLADQYYAKAAEPLLLQPRDTVEIFEQAAVEPAFEVEIRGAVARPDKYEWASNLRLSHLLTLAGGALPGAYMPRADLLRLRPDRSYELIAVNLSDAIAGSANADLALQRGDILTVPARDEVRNASVVHAAGFVRNAGKYPRHEGMRVSDLLFAAGGLLPGAGPTVELTSGHFEGQPASTTLAVTGQPGQYAIEPDVLLTDDDTVTVVGRGQYKSRVDLVYLEGRVDRPGSYVLASASPEQPYTVYDLLQEGGGLLADANPNGVVVYRRRGVAMGTAQAEDLQRLLQSVNQEVRQSAMQIDEEDQVAALTARVERSLGSVLSSSGSVSIVLPPQEVSERDWVSAIPVNGAELIATGGRSGNLELEAGDTVTVPRRVNTVTVLGAVPRSGAVPYIAGQTCDMYIRESGGLREDAAVDRMVVVHANGSAAPINQQTVLEHGDIVVVPTKHIVRTVRTESAWQQWFKSIVGLTAAALIF
jgi:protein involved in polysaccharide export with SLBB domain